MNYAKLYVDVYTHHRFIKAGFEASGYWMHALAYLRHQESSDGFLPDGTITVPLASPRAQCVRLCEKLVSVGLFQRVEGGYVLLRYAERNETKADIRLAKEAAKERKARSRQRRAGTPSAGDVTRDAVASPCAGTPPDEEGMSHVTLFGSASACVSASGYASASGSVSESVSESASDIGSEAANRHRLPPSERAISGSYWLEAFTEGITKHTGRPCTAGRFYVTTLERIVEHHAPARDAAQACAWIREQATTFAAKWDGQHPPKGLTPDGLERWLNDGRGGPPQFGNPKIVQLPADEWKPDDFSDLGATTLCLGTKGAPRGGPEHE